MLFPYKILDLTDERGWMAGFLLAQLGAEVTLVEPTGGYRRSLTFEAYNRGKRSVISRGHADVAQLAGAVDVVIENGSVASVDRVDLDALRAGNPQLITVSITPYGSTGPKAHWRATDLTLVASSGQMSLTGDNDRPPVRTTVPQAWAHAAADGAVGALIALADRERSGLGQHVDVSAQQAVALTGLPAVLYAPVGLEVAQRESGGIRLGSARLRWVYPTIDGYVAISFTFGSMIGPFTARLMGWVCEEGFGDETMANRDWIGFGDALVTGSEPWSELDRCQDALAAFTVTKTKAQMLDGAMARRLLVAPVSTMQDVVESTQLSARSFWDEIDGVHHPGPMVNASETPLAALGPAPKQPGCDDVTARASLHAVPAVLPAAGAVLPAAGAVLPAAGAVLPAAGAVLPLAGLNVLDMSWVLAAPLATRLLAYWGATVVRVESVTRPDLTRIALGHRDDILEVENGISWQAANAGKLGLALNLSVPQARDTVRDLARWADVLVESFTPKTMRSWGLGYDDLAAENPSLIMLSSCVMGQDGPLANFAGFGNLSASIAGFFDVTGWPDRPPAGPYMAYTDYTSPRFTMCALLAALDHRRRTGQGQYLDFSQMEAATHLLTPALLAYQRTGTLISRDGNADPHLVPHGVYPAAGVDGWIAIVCESDDDWRRLTIDMRRPDLTALGMADRVERRHEIDSIVGEWTSRQDPIGLTYRLQEQGIAAHAVSHSGEAVADPQLAHRGHFCWLDHPYARRSIVDTPSMHMSRTSGRYDWAGPVYGQHVEEVLGGLLGYDEEKIADLAVSGALE